MVEKTALVALQVILIMALIGLVILYVIHIRREKIKFSEKFVPRLLTDGQQENRVSISQDMLANADADGNFMKNRLGSSRLFFYYPY